MQIHERYPQQKNQFFKTFNHKHYQKQIFIKMLLKSTFNLKFFLSILKRRSPKITLKVDQINPTKQQQDNHTAKDVHKFSVFHQNIRTYSSYSNFYEDLKKMNDAQFNTNINIILSTMNENAYSITGYEYFIKTIKYMVQKNLKDSQLILLLKILTKQRKHLNFHSLAYQQKQIIEFINAQLSNLQAILKIKCKNNELNKQGLIHIISLSPSNFFITEAIYALNQMIGSQGKKFNLNMNNFCYLLKGYYRYDIKHIKRSKHINNYILHAKFQQNQYYYGQEIFLYGSLLKLHLISDEQKIPSFLEELKPIIKTHHITQTSIKGIIRAYNCLPLNFDNQNLYRILKLTENIRYQSFLNILEECPVHRLSPKYRQFLLQRLQNIINNVIVTSEILYQFCLLQNMEYYFDQNIVNIIDQKSFTLLKKEIGNPKIQFYHYIMILKLLTRKYVSIQRYLQIITEPILKNMNHIEIFYLNQFLLILQISRSRNYYDVGNQKIQILQQEVMLKIRQLKPKKIDQLIKICKYSLNADFKSIQNIHRQILAKMKRDWEYIKSNQYTRQALLILALVKYPINQFKEFVTNIIMAMSSQDFNNLIDHYIARDVKTYVLTDLILNIIIQRQQPNLKEFFKIVVYCLNTLKNDKGTINSKIPTIMNSKFILNQTIVQPIQKFNVNLILLSKFTKVCSEMGINLGSIKNLILNIASNCQKFKIQELFLICESFFQSQWTYLSKAEIINIATKFYDCFKVIDYHAMDNHNFVKLLSIYQKLSTILQNKNQVFTQVLVGQILRKIEQGRSNQKFSVIWLLLELDLKGFISLQESKKKYLLLKLDANKGINIIYLNNFISFAKNISETNTVIYERIRKYLIPVIWNIYNNSNEFKSSAIMIEYYELALTYKSTQMIPYILSEIQNSRLTPVETTKLVDSSSKKRIFENKIFEIAHKNYYLNRNYYQNLQIRIIFFFCKSFYELPPKYMNMINDLFLTIQKRAQGLFKTQKIINDQEAQYYIGRPLNALWCHLLLERTQTRLFQILVNIFINTIIQKLKSMHSEYLLGMVNDIYLMLKLRNIYVDSKFDADMQKIKKVWQRNNVITLTEQINYEINKRNFIQGYIKNDVKVDYYNKQSNTILLFLHSYLINSTGVYQTGFSKIRDMLIKQKFKDAKVIKFNLRTSNRLQILQQINQRLGNI